MFESVIFGIQEPEATINKIAPKDEKLKVTLGSQMLRKPEESCSTSITQSVTTIPTLDGLPWYKWWIQSQLKGQPKELFASLPEFDIESKEVLGGPFSNLWNEISRLITGNHETSIDEVSQLLLNDDTISGGAESSSCHGVKQLVFCIIGWQTMLYRPDPFSSPPTELCIADETDGYRSQAQMCLKQSLTACKRRIPDFLMGFGVMLPPPNYCASESLEEKKAFDQLVTVDVTAFNAHLLTTIGGLTIHWIDSLACHMEFDVDTKSLYLFRYPSFCAARLPGQAMSGREGSVLHCCAKKNAIYNTWATSSDVTQLLKEVILSYRLLFGQDAKSCRLFRKLKPFDGIPAEGKDTLLSDLCGRQTHDLALATQRDIYRLRRDFPMLRSRLTRLVAYLERKRPRTWRELWVDKRDSASWLTFWAVIMIGGMGLVLGLLQVILQIVQIVYKV
ncbi:MAG: hypothetical protein M1820_003632 [Bogoriella megaspora]|nr:MAG: hypothetical protein M1820_003632 [Bogoriella megaspora]